MCADDFTVFRFCMQIRDGNFSRQSAFKRLNHTHAIVYAQNTHDIFMRMRQHLGNNHAVAANALGQHRIPKKRAVCILLGAGINGAVLSLHADCAFGHTANGQLHRLFFLCALGAHIPHGPLVSRARSAV